LAIIYTLQKKYNRSNSAFQQIFPYEPDNAKSGPIERKVEAEAWH
jgi:hypothetical protein